MKWNRVWKAGLALLTLVLLAMPGHAQKSTAHRAGCQNAEDLNDQATSVISDIQKLAPSNNSQTATDQIDTLAKQVNSLRAQLAYCFTEEAGKDENALAALRNPSQKLRMIITTADYLDFVYKTRWGQGDNSFLAGMMPPDVERKIPQCNGALTLLSETDSFITHADADSIMPRDVEPLYHRAKELIVCGGALEKNGYQATAASLFMDAAGIDNLMVLADSNSESILERALAKPATQFRQAQPMQLQPIIIRSGPRTCTGHDWGDGSFRTIDWSCN